MALPLVVTEVRVAGAAGDHERVVVEGPRPPAVGQVAEDELPAPEVEADDLREEDARVRLPLQERAERSRDLGGGQGSGGNLVGERLEEVEVLPVDERHVDRSPPERAHRPQPAEAASDHDHPLPHVLSLHRRSLTSEARAP